MREVEAGAQLLEVHQPEEKNNGWKPPPSPQNPKSDLKTPPLRFCWRISVGFLEGGAFQLLKYQMVKEGGQI